MKKPRRFIKLNTLAKRRIHFLILLLIFLLFLHIILFVPRDAEEMLNFGKMRLGDVETYHIHLTMKENVEMSSKDAPALKQFGMKKVKIPVTWEKDVYHTEDGEMVTCSCDYKFEGVEDSFVQGSLSKGGQEYLLKEEHYEPMTDDDTVPAALGSIDPEELLEVEHAKMRRLFGDYRMTVGSGDADVMLQELLGVKGEPGSKLVVTFDRVSHLLESISGEGLKADGRTIQFRMTFDTEEEAVAEALSKAEEAVQETAEPPKAEGDSHKLTTEDLKKRGERCYTAGIDFPAGTYTVSPQKGRGIILGLSGKDGSELFRYNYGYDYFRIDTIEKKETRKQKLGEGTRIFLSGKDMVVLLKKAD